MTTSLISGREPTDVDPLLSQKAFTLAADDELLDAYSSSEAVLLDFEFDGELTASNVWDAKSTIEDQLLYTIGHLNGDRAVGTQLAADHPAQALLRRGEAYRGPAVLFGKSFMTAYFPVSNSAGKVIGILYVGIPMAQLDAMLAREGRSELAEACFRFLPDRVRLDLAGWAAEDIFAHS